MKTLLVTVGSTRFDKLVDRVLENDFVEMLSSSGFNLLRIQAGSSDYDRKQVENLMSKYNVEIDIYEYKNSIADDIEAADIIISHAGAGTCIEVLRSNKRLVIVVNDTLMDNHQIELADQLENDNYAIKANSVEEVVEKFNLICDTKSTKLDRFPLKDEKRFEKIFNEELKKLNSNL